MTIHEYGRNNEKIVVLVHPSVVMWDFFEYVVPLLEKEYHVIIPALPGYDEENPDEDFTSVEDIAGELGEWFIRNKITAIDVLYGCSMGGSVVLRMLADSKVTIKNTICDGGITPYQLPWLLTRFIAIKDFLLIAMGKIGGLGLLEKAFATDEYSKEDLKYMAKVLHFISYKTIWRTFESCNNYTMPKNPVKYPGKFEYWYGDKESKERKEDMNYVNSHISHVEFVEMKDMGHASMAPLYPEKMAERIRALLEEVTDNKFVSSSALQGMVTCV